MRRRLTDEQRDWAGRLPQCRIPEAVAARLSAGGGGDYAELLGVANLAYVLAVARFDAAKSPEGEAGRQPWAYANTLREAASYRAACRRKGAARAVLSLDWESAGVEPGQVGTLAMEVAAPDTFLEGADARLDAQGVLARLPAREATALRLWLLDGLRLCDVGARMGFSRARAHQVCHGALARLRGEREANP